MAFVDDESAPGSWARELNARGRRSPLVKTLWSCICGWSGTEPSITDASSEVERNGRVEIERTHLAACPKCFETLNKESK